MALNQSDLCSVSSTYSASILEARIAIEVDSAMPWYQIGPSNLFSFTVLQGFFTLLFINEFVSVVRGIIKKQFSDSLNPNKVLLWHMVESWEDLYKITNRVLFPKSTYAAYFPSKYRASHSQLAYSRFVLSFLIYGVVFGTDLLLIVGGVPTRESRNVKEMTKIGWSNTGPVFKLKKSNTQHGSFSRVVALNSSNNDVEFIRIPSVSLERTDYRDFVGSAGSNQMLPDYDGKLIHCSWEECWRLLCRVRTCNRFYQYKLRLDVSTGDDSQFFVPTANFSVTGKNGNSNTLDVYVREIQSQLGINVSQTMKDDYSFTIKAFADTSTSQCGMTIPENTTLANGDVVLTHDAVATLFLSTIHVRKACVSEMYYQRLKGTRRESKNIAHGAVATSQRPYLPLIAIIFLYLVAQIVSILLQRFRGRAPQNMELSLMLEVFGAKCTIPYENLYLPSLPIQRTQVGTEDDERLAHVGFLPVSIVTQIHEYIRHICEDCGPSKIAGNCEITTLSQLDGAKIIEGPSKSEMGKDVSEDLV